MNKRMNVFISSFIILNIAVLIAVICLITRQNGDQGQNQDSISSGDMKNNIDKAYGEHIASGHEKQENTTYDVRATNISPQMANLLKPIAFFTGLNNTGLVKGDDRRVTAARGWAAPETQVLYNGMQNDHGSITVPAAGVYMVYSHVTFNTNQESGFLHRITRYNAEKQEENVAFTNEVSGTWHTVKGGGMVLPSDIRGILELNAGDQLRVDISRLNQSDYEEDWYYFGLHKI